MKYLLMFLLISCSITPNVVNAELPNGIRGYNVSCTSEQECAERSAGLCGIHGYTIYVVYRADDKNKLIGKFISCNTY